MKKDRVYLVPQPGIIRQMPGTCTEEKETVRRENASLGPEAYRIRIGEDQIVVEAGGKAGLFYADRTLEQLRFQCGGALPCLEIEDAPEYGYRSFHIDTARHYFPAGELKRMADAAASFKLNRFHWHFSDDQGWRIESRVFPRLHEIGARRSGDHFGAYSSDETEYRYYTQDEVRDMVSYCSGLQIEIVPEIDIPGHVTAILAAYPELSCTGKQVEVAASAGIFPEILCPGKEETFSFLFDLLDELCDLFPGRYFHIGGDEVPKTRWESCPCCRKRMEEENLSDTRQLQGYLANRAAAHLREKGKTVIAWNEAALGGNLDPGVVLQLWNDDPKDPALRIYGAERDENGKLTGPNQGIGSKHIRRGGYVICSSMMGSYCDYPHAFISARKIYEADVIPQKCGDIQEEAKEHIRGVEALCWTEYIRTAEELEAHAWPRYAAKAEVGWSGEGRPGYKDFAKRMRALYPYLKSKVPYAAPPEALSAGSLYSIREMISFAKNFSRQTISGFAEAQKEV